MKRTLLLLVTLAAFGCTQFRDVTAADYEAPFYAKYLNTGSALDARISRTLDALRAEPNAAHLHNELGMLLVQKGFPRDAEREFERAIDADRKYHEAWYNLGLIRAAHGDEGGARRAYSNTIEHKPGHAHALFQLGLIEEKLKHTDRAVDLYAKAFGINPKLMEVSTNPRILDTQLLHLALIKMYPNTHDRQSMQFQGMGAGPRMTPQQPQAPSNQPSPQQIIPPTAPATDPSQQRPPS